LTLTLKWFGILFTTNTLSYHFYCKMFLSRVVYCCWSSFSDGWEVCALMCGRWKKFSAHIPTVALLLLCTTQLSLNNDVWYLSFLFYCGSFI
jgi:hypothetical protein